MVAVVMYISKGLLFKYFSSMQFIQFFGHKRNENYDDKGDKIYC